MFTFGLFSTHMPYVVMVAVYAFYFLFTSPTFKQVETPAADQQTNQTELAESDKTETLPAFDLYFADFQIQATTEKPPEHCIIKPFYSPPDTCHFRDGCYFSTFSRPPPVIS
jgi:hypothetical protein